ncbi:MAG: hypothetical protein ACRDYC_07510 [Acidimicrobiales bacterium]
MDALYGVSPGGERVECPGGTVLLAFLTSGCLDCGTFWEGLVPGWMGGGTPSAAIVTPDPSTESQPRVAQLAPAGTPVVMCTDAWVKYGVIWAPWFILLRQGRVVTQGHVAGWDDLEALLAGEAGSG